LSFLFLKMYTNIIQSKRAPLNLWRSSANVLMADALAKLSHSPLQFVKSSIHVEFRLYQLPLCFSIYFWIILFALTKA
jgi:hypothetical protein